MAYSKLNIVRDCWWTNPSSVKLYDETGQGSTYNNGLYKSLNPLTTSYITFPISGGYDYRYVGRLEHTTIVPDIIQINITTSGNLYVGGLECDLKINNVTLPSITLNSETAYGVTTAYIDTTDPSIRGGLLVGRYQDNYDFFTLTFNKAANQLIKVYNLEILYSGVNTWDNYTAGLPNVLSKYCYPNSLGFRNSSQWVNQQGTLVNGSGWYHINESGVGTDSTYLRHLSPPQYNLAGTLTDTWRMPNGGLTIGFEVNNPEMLINGNFDNGLTGWTNNGWDTAEISSGNLHLVTDGVPNYGCIYQAIDVIVGQRYRLRCSKDASPCYVKVGQSAGGASLDNGYTDTYTSATFRDYIFTPVVSPAYVMFVYTTLANNVTIYNISVTLDNPESLTQVTRAQMTLRMSLPPSGQYENARDTFEINGYNSRFKEQDYKDEMTDAIGSVPSRNSQYGYFIYGAGPIVEQSGFKDYRVELNFLDPELSELQQYDCNIASTKYRNIDIFNTMEFRLIGLPSGTLLSAANLYLEYLPNDTLGLYTVGGLGLNRQFVSSTVDVGGLDNPLFGDGAWQHRGSLNEATIFDAFYKFNEASGTYTYPISLNAASGCYGEYVNRINEDIIYEGGVATGANYTFFPVEPQRRNYYRNPVRTTFGTLYDPKYYRDLIYNGLAILPFDIHNPNQSRYSPNTAQVYFGNRLNIGTDFTLYFMLYREPTNEGQVFGKIFQRSLLGSQGDIKFEIVGALGTEDITFAIKDTNDSTHRLTLPLPVYGIEPLLIWVTCKYDQPTNKTTFKLAAHTDVRNYFTTDWLYVEKIFNFARKQYQDVKTGIGPLYSPQDLDQELAFSSFLSFVSLCEFGWADSAIDLAYNTSDDLIKDSYDISTDIDKQFFASRVCNGEYLQARAPNSDTIGGDPIASSGWKTPGFAYEGSLIPLNGQEWTNAGGIQTEGYYAASHDVLWQYGTPSLYLIGTNFNFNIPASSIITGMEVRYKGMETGIGRVEVLDVQLLTFDNVSYIYTPVGYSQASSGPRYLPDTFYQKLTYGGPSNLWGLTTDMYSYTPEEILTLVNDNSFGVGLRVRSATGSPATAYIDLLEMKIYTSGVQTGTLDEFKHLTWLVPTGSGAAQWSTKYKVDDWNHDEYQLYNPITTAGTHHLVHPSAIYIEIETEHNTNHPSGLQLICDIELDTGSTDNWKVFRTEFNIPSGSLSTRVQGFTKHIGMSSEAVLYSDIDQIGLNLITKYADIGSQQYYGDLGIKSIKVYFDSYSASITGAAMLWLYTDGTHPTTNLKQDLFIEGHMTANSLHQPDLFLYTIGIPYYASGDFVSLYTEGHMKIPDSGTTLYIDGIPWDASGQMPLYLYNIPHQTATLFIEGLDPPEESGLIPLYTHATPAGIGGLYKSTDLYMMAKHPLQYISLYINANNESGVPLGSIPLYLQGVPIPTATMNLYIPAPTGEMRPGVTFLYTRGLGTTEGAYTVNARAPLFMARNSESIEKSMSLYMAQAQNYKITDLYIEGTSVKASSIPMYIKGSGIPNETVKLYTHGF